jgi:uncharacterized protein YukE
MGNFSVDVASLRALSGRLRAGADELSAVLGELSGVTPGQLGTASLDEACQEFQEKWQHGMSLMRENVTRVGAGLDATAATYQQHEQQLSQLFGSLVDPAADSPGRGGAPGPSGEGAP